MYDYKLEEHEYIVFDSNSVFIECGDVKEKLALIITNKNFVILKDINKESILNITRKGYEIPKYIPIFKLEISKIKSCRFIDNTTHIVTNDIKLYIYDLNLVALLNDGGRGKRI